MVWGLDYIKYLRENWRAIAKRVKEIANGLGKVEKVYVFGSVIEDKITGASDLDIAIIFGEKLTDKEKIERTLKILDKLDEINVDIDLKVLSKEEEKEFLELIKNKFVEI